MGIKSFFSLENKAAAAVYPVLVMNDYNEEKS